MGLSAALGTYASLEGYKTPLGKLARRFKASVELWKTKYHELKRQNKREQNRVADSRRSREHWKQQAQQWEATAGQLQAELDRVRAETADPKSKLAKSS